MNQYIDDLWLIVVFTIQFYIVSLTFVGCLVRYDDPALLNSGSTSNTWTSPFVLAIKNAGVGGLPSVFNAVILIAVLSVGNASVYGASRTLAALADQGQAPKILGYIDNAGRPLVSIILASALVCLCYIVNLSPSRRQEAWNWMFAVSGLASIFTWGSICLCHIRFRAAWKLNGHTLDELPYRSQAGVIGSWVGFGINCIVLSKSSDPEAHSILIASYHAPIAGIYSLPLAVFANRNFLPKNSCPVLDGLCTHRLRIHERGGPNQELLRSLPGRTRRHRLLYFFQAVEEELEVPSPCRYRHCQWPSRNRPRSDPRGRARCPSHLALVEEDV